LKNDFIESVVAFSNSNRGIILVGVTDKGDIVGSHVSPEGIQKIIHDSCDPPPTNVKIQEREIAGNKIVMVEVPEGGDKPYQSRRDQNWYVRHNANDMRITRSELMRLLEKQKGFVTSPGLSGW
jgi:ATP-dependent DNA helicase RecG